MAIRLRRRLPGAPVRSLEHTRAEEKADREFYQHVAETGPSALRSIRVRLTAWYALILLVILIALGLVLRTFLLRSFDQDVESRLANAATEVSGLVSVSYVQRGGSVDANGNVSFPEQQPVPGITNPENIAFSGLWTGIFDVNGRLQDEFTGLGVEDVPEEIQQSLAEANVFDLTEGTFVNIPIDDTDNRVYAAPLVVDGGEGQAIIGTLVVGEPLASRERMLNQINNVLQLAGLTGLILATAGGWLIAGRALSPVQRITKTAATIANSEGVVSLSRRLEVPASGDELTRLSLTFNSMLDRIEVAFKAQQRFVGDASHELRTPLTSIRGNVDVMIRQLRSGREVDREDMADALGDVQRESARMGRLISDLLVLARTDASSLGSLLSTEPVSLEVLAQESITTGQALVRGQALVLDVRDELTVPCDGDRIVQVMLILIDNALRYTPPGGIVTLRVSAQDDPEDGVRCARIDVIDEGPGIPPLYLPHLFERFYRVEDSRNRQSGGTGLGLSIAMAIVRGHRGWIDVETREREGTMFSVWLPLPEPLAVTAGESTTDVEATTGRTTALPAGE